MNNFFNKLSNDTKIRIPSILAIIAFIFVIINILFSKEFFNFNFIIVYSIGVALPFLLILDNDIESMEIDYLIPSISSLFIIIYTSFSLFQTYLI